MNNKKIFLILEIVIFLVFVLTIVVLFFFSGQKAQLSSYVLSIDSVKPYFWNCSPKEALKEIKDEIDVLEQKYKEEKKRFLFVSDFEVKLKLVDSPGLYFMKRLKSTEQKYSQYSSNLKNLGFPSSMPEDSEVPLMMYNLEAMDRILSTNAKISLKKVSFDFDAQNIPMLVELKTDLKGVMCIYKALNKEPIIQLSNVEISTEERPFLDISLKIYPKSEVVKRTTAENVVKK